MHYYIYISALQRGQIRCETEKAKTYTKKALPHGKSSGDNSQEAMDFTYSPTKPLPTQLLPCQSRKQTLVENIFISNFIQNVHYKYETNINISIFFTDTSNSDIRKRQFHFNPSGPYSNQSGQNNSRILTSPISVPRECEPRQYSQQESYTRDTRGEY